MQHHMPISHSPCRRRSKGPLPSCSIPSCLLGVGLFLPPHSQELLTDIPLSPLLSPQTDSHKEAAKKSWPPAVGNNLLAQSVRRPCGRRKGIRTAQCVCSLFASSLILRNMSHGKSRPEAKPPALGLHPVHFASARRLDG